MSEDHAVPPTREERDALIARIKRTLWIAMGATALAVYLLMEFGGEFGDRVLGTLVVAGFAAWLMTWPMRKWKQWQKGRRKRE
jgi:hypothetical protein